MNEATLSERAGGDPVLHLYLGRSQAGVMAFFGLVIMFGAGLLAVIQFQPQVPLYWRVLVGLLTLYLAWVGAAFVLGAWRFMRRPLYTLTAEALIGHDESGDHRLPLEKLQEVAWRKARGIGATVLVFEGAIVDLPHSLRGAEETGRRLKAYLASRKEGTS